MQLKHHVGVCLRLRLCTCTAREGDLLNLRTHKKAHDGSKPYSCSACGKAFDIASNMRKHVTFHNREGSEEGHDNESEAKPGFGEKQREEEQGEANIEKLDDGN